MRVAHPGGGHTEDYTLDIGVELSKDRRELFCGKARMIARGSAIEAKEARVSTACAALGETPPEGGLRDA